MSKKEFYLEEMRNRVYACRGKKELGSSTVEFIDGRRITLFIDPKTGRRWTKKAAKAFLRDLYGRDK